MKNLQRFLILMIIIVSYSCSKTEVTRQETDDIESVTAPPIPGLFKKRVLIEDFTGTWCGNCTAVLYAIDKVYENPNNSAVTVAVHSGNDPFKYIGIDPLHNFIFPNGSVTLPEARLNRTTVWSDPDTNVAKALNLRSNNCGLGLALKSSLVDNDLSVQVKIKLAQNYSGLKLVVYILEDKLRFKQTNYLNFFNAVNPILNFEHNHVLRKSITDLLGDSLTESTIDGTTITKVFNLPVPNNIANKNNISIAAFVVNQSNTVINVRGGYLNENQSFEENL